MTGYILIFLGGGIGASLRYLLTVLSYKHFDVNYPIGTFIVNIIGCLFIGFVMALIMSKTHILNDNLKLFLTVGLAGGFTTFSTFSYESLTLLKNGQVLTGMIYMVLSPLACLGAVYLGTYFAKYI
ncbi:MAG: fluoride efflux transporter CrcB [Candidatus Gastranaerophilales bacterium]|nr:fluoride efflux transporter CrcB [Candidatus Gastranaerophilales bacterium]